MNIEVSCMYPPCRNACLWFDGCDDKFHLKQLITL